MSTNGSVRSAVRGHDLGSYLDQWMEDERLSASWALSSLILGSTIAYTGTGHSKPVWESGQCVLRRKTKSSKASWPMARRSSAKAKNGMSATKIMTPTIN